MKILCYNIHRAMDASNKSTINSMIRFFKSQNPDVICLQEVMYCQFLYMKVFLNMDGVFAANVVKRISKYGICIFSKRKIQMSEHVFLPSKKEQRGFLYVTIKLDNKKILKIINTHLGLDSDERKDQINTILNYIKKLDGNMVLCGDFNEKNINLDEFIDCAIYLHKDDIPTFKTSRIDYIFCSKNCIPKKYFVNSSNLSDHFPITAYIDVYG